MDTIAKAGATPLVVCDGATVCLSAIHLKDIVKGGIRERFSQFRRMGIKTIMIAGDNPLQPRPPLARRTGWTTSLPRPPRRRSCKLVRNLQGQGGLWR